MSADLWSIVAAVSAAVQTIVIIIALLFAIAQLRESARARSTEAMRQIFEALARPEARLERKLVYQSPGVNFDAMPDEELQHLWNVAISFNHVGLLVKRGYLPAEVVYDIYGDAAVRSWRVLKSLVEQERKRRGDQDDSPYYLKYFEELANSSEEYLKKHYPNYLLLTYRSSDSDAGDESTAHFV
jgi:uncharacterized protein YggT (Ycf19 family)